MTSGAFAGLAGAFLAFEVNDHWREGQTLGLGFIARGLSLARFYEDRTGAWIDWIVPLATAFAEPDADYDVLLAYAENGQTLRPDDKGPLWIVYPFSANPGLKKDIYFSRCVWQLSGLTVQ